MPARGDDRSLHSNSRALCGASHDLISDAKRGGGQECRFWRRSLSRCGTGRAWLRCGAGDDDRDVHDGGKSRRNARKKQTTTTTSQILRRRWNQRRGARTGRKIIREESMLYHNTPPAPLCLPVEETVRITALGNAMRLMHDHSRHSTAQNLAFGHPLVCSSTCV